MESPNLGEKMEKTISIANNFNKFPAGRYLTDGPYSGEQFRTEYLVPLLNNKEISTLKVSLDGLGGVGSSFWDEAFGIGLPDDCDHASIYTFATSPYPIIGAEVPSSLDEYPGAHLSLALPVKLSQCQKDVPYIISSILQPGGRMYMPLSVPPWSL